MTERRLESISVDRAMAALRFLPDRTPATTDAEASGSFAELSTYRDGGIFVGHWAGASEWERHPVGDEIVMVVDGTTTISLLGEDGEESAQLGPGDLIIVPKGTWHRFRTPDQVKVMTVTPQPTDHTSDPLPADT